MNKQPLHELLRVESDRPTTMNLAVIQPRHAPIVSYLRLFEAASLRLDPVEGIGIISTIGKDGAGIIKLPPDAEVRLSFPGMTPAHVNLSVSEQSTRLELDMDPSDPSPYDEGIADKTSIVGALVIHLHPAGDSEHKFD